MPKERIDSKNLDSNETIFFVNELNHKKSVAKEKKFPMLKGANGTLIPISQEAAPADKTISYEYQTEAGIAKVIASYADDLPKVNVKSEIFTSKIESIGNSYDYNIMDVKAQAKTGKSLSARKAVAAKKANDIKVNSIAWKGSEKYGLVGLLSHPNITSEAVSTGASSGQTTWALKTPAEILLDMNNAVINTVDLTNGVESPNTMLLPIAQHALVHTTKLDSGSDTTIAEFFLKNNPSITSIEWVNEMKDVTPLPSGTAGTKDCMVTYYKDPEYLSLELPIIFEQMPVQEKNLAFVVNCHSRCGGVVIPYPLVIRVVEGI